MRPSQKPGFRALVLALLLIVPSTAADTLSILGPNSPLNSPEFPGTSGAFAPDARSDAVHRLVGGWLSGEPSIGHIPASASELLASMRSTEPFASPIPSGGGWARFFESFGLVPSPRERAALSRFQAEHPHVAAEVELLAAEVGTAEMLRQSAFGELSSAEKARLPVIAVILASNRASEIGANDQRALEKINWDAMIEGASRIVLAAERAEKTLPTAAALDDLLARNALLTHGGTEDIDAASILRKLATTLDSQAKPMALPSSTAARGVIERSTTDFLARPGLPADLARPLSILLVDLGPVIDGSPEADRAFINAIAQNLPQLTRAGYNLSVAPHGLLVQLGGEKRPSENLAATGLSQPAMLLEDLVGPTGKAPEASFIEGLSRLHTALEIPLSSQDVKKADQVSTQLGPTLSASLGRLMAAQARYQETLGPGAALPSLVVELRRQTDPIIEGSGPLTMEDLRVLHESAEAESAWQEALAKNTGAVLEAAMAVREAASGSETYPGSTTTSSSAGEIIFNQAGVLILGSGDNTLTENQFPSTPILLIDLGGNDTYEISLAGVSQPEPDVRTPVGTNATRTSVAIDLGGNDTYRSPRPFTLGAAQGGPGAPALAIFLDAEGKDAYFANEAALGWGSDGVGIAIDASGDDDYAVTIGGLGGAGTTESHALAAGIFLDASGDDKYRAPKGFAHLFGGKAGSQLTLAAFTDLAGRDAYLGPCNSDVSIPCFATPRGESPETGVLVFWDADGNNSYPQRRTGPDPPPEAYDGKRFYVVQDGPPDGTPMDSDGDRIPDDLDGGPDRRDGLAKDSDGDGTFDGIEALARTDPGDSQDYAVPVGSLFSTPGQLPEGGFLLNLPSLVAIGLPGPTTYRHSYALSIDLGLADKDTYRNATAVDGYAVDLGGNDTYAPLDPSRGIASSTKSASVLLDLGGDDFYMANSSSLAHANGPLALAILLDVAGDDRYDSPRGNSTGYASQGGMAAFLDLDGDDRYYSPSQGFVGGPSIPATAIFLDAKGNDVYHRNVSTQYGEIDRYQGNVEWNLTVPTGHVETAIAAFLDLGGKDKYLVRRHDTNLTLDVSNEKNDQLRIRPLDSYTGGAIAVRLDTELAQNDADKDGSLDATETFAATDAHDPDEAPVNGRGFLLNVPRLGMAVGDMEPTSWSEGPEYALAVDLGGDDHYGNRAGSSTPVFPTALALDLVGDDTYHYTRNSTLHKEAVSRLTGIQGTLDLKESALFGGAQGAGILGIGVLSDRGGVNRFILNVTFEGCVNCTGEVAAFGAGQGAGLLGIGVLSVFGGGAGSTFEAMANVSLAPNENASGFARTHAQGAGIMGVGILASERPLLDDSYELRSSATGGLGQDMATSGQGYGLAGVGMLLDNGGDNAFTADRLAQATVDADAGAGPFERAPPSVFLTALGAGAGSAGVLLLPGIGDDRLQATRQSQAYAGGRGLALLLDLEGDDYRTLLPPTGVAGHGQAAAADGGLALLFDHRGNDRYVANGSRVQAFSSGGTALLVDLSGVDSYKALDLGQSAVANLTSTEPGFAFFLDKSGNDEYSVGGRGWGHASGASSSVGSAVFGDLGGIDSYVGNPPGRLGLPGYPSNAPRSGNDWGWQLGAGSTLRGTGIDENRPSGAAKLLLEAASPAAGTRLEARLPSGTPPTGALERTILLHSRLEAGSAGLSPSLIDRAEYYFDDVFLGTGSPSGSEFILAWPTETRDENGYPSYPDGRHTVDAMLYPRVGTPTALDATGERAAADGEPFPASASFDLDNPPVARAPDLPIEFSTRGPVRVNLTVDRDLESGTCPACDDFLYLSAGQDEWIADLSGIGPWNVTTNFTPAAGEIPTVARASGADRVYLYWNPPTSSADAVSGYLINRASGAGTVAPIGFLDARAHRDALGKLRYVDEPPASPATYRVDTVRRANDTYVIAIGTQFPVTLDHERPGPATGLQALGAESAVRLVWREAPGASQYVVNRTRNSDGANASFQAVNVTTFVDSSAAPDENYTYSVLAYSATGASTTIPAPTAVARASPGHNVTLLLRSAEEEGDREDLVLFDNASFGGAQRHTFDLSLDQETLTDGAYYIVTTTVDGKARVSFPAITNVTLDGTPPNTQRGFPRFVGSRFLNGTGALTLPFSVVDDGVGLAETTAFLKRNGTEWTRYATTSWTDPPNQGAVTRGNASIPLVGISDGAEFELSIVSRDRVGNVEGMRDEKPWPISSNSMEDGFLDMMEVGNWTQHILDLTAPTGVSQDLETVVTPGTSVDLWTLVSESGAGLARVEGVIGAERVPLYPWENDQFVGLWVAKGTGEFSVNIEMTDHADNVGVVRAGIVTVDPDPPVFESLVVSFPDARTAGRAGEKLTIRAVITDGLSALGSLDAQADVSGFSTLETVGLAWDGGSYVARDIVVDRLSGTVGSEVAVSAVDKAGNVATKVATVIVSDRPVPMSAPVIAGVGPDWILINWTTQEVGYGRIDYGIGPQLKSKSGLEGPGLKHSIRLSALEPETEYFLRAVTVTSSGIETVSGIVTASTTDALTVTVHPISGVPFTNGTTVVDVTIRRYDGRETPATADLYVQGPRGPARIIASTNGSGDDLVRLDFASLRDGNYTLMAKGQASDGHGESAPIGLVLDRTAPLLRLTGDTVLLSGKPTFVVVEERGSGFDLENSTWTIEGQPCAPFVEPDRMGCLVPSLDRDGAVKMEVKVADRAGNVNTLRAKVLLDGAAPTFGRVSIVGAEGRTKLLPGADARLELEVNDFTTERVWTNLSSLGGDENTSLRHLGGQRYEVTFKVPTHQEDGMIEITVSAVDASNRISEARAIGHVDGTPPHMSNVETIAAGYTWVSLGLVTNEPTTAILRAAGPVGPQTVESKARGIQHTLRVEGLSPGFAVKGIVTVSDEAGNDITAPVTLHTVPDVVPPSPIEGLFVEDVGDGVLRVRWDAARDDVGIRGYRITRIVSSTTSSNLPLATETWAIDRIPSGTAATYEVAAEDLGGNFGPTARVEAYAHGLPRLANPTVDPPLGAPGTYEFSVTVQDSSGQVPTLFVYVDEVAVRMKPDGENCTAGCKYRAQVQVGPQTLKSGPHRYSFEAASGPFRVPFPQGTTLIGPIVVADGSAGPGSASALSALNVTPLGLGDMLTFPLAALALALFQRRRRYHR
ncbi:MAG: hypothetical protein HY556_10480 [Euryarchaeota archaeon]|nr:hypothetical protein [Euryarchaeota archaeon]